MAVGASLDSNNLSIGLSKHGFAVPIFQGREAALQTFARGAVLVMSSGLLAEAAADVTSGIVGIAMTAGNNKAAGASNTCLYIPAWPGVLFEATFEDETNEAHVLAVTNLGVKYALQKTTGTGPNWYLDENDSGNGVGLIVPSAKNVQAIGETRARVEFMFDISATIYG